MLKLVVKTLVGDYGFNFKTKIVIINCGFNFKIFKVVTNYGFDEKITNSGIILKYVLI